MDESIHLPAKWADWVLDDSLGAGSFGTVWRAHNAAHPEETAAVKIIRIPSNESEENALSYEYPDLHDRTSYCENLVQSVLGEIHTMELLKENAHVVQIRDSFLEHEEGSMEWTVFLMMELLTPLQEYLLTHPMDEKEVLRLGTELCSALDCCEQKGILHRDIKPENILVSPDGTFKIGDFGVARQISGASLSMSLRGTFTYMAPEIYHGEAYASQADQYSLGLVMYRFLNHNRDPFIDPGSKMVFYKDREEALRKRMGGQPLPAPADASPDAASVILKCCAYRKEDRYPTFALCRQALEECLNGRQEETGVTHNAPKSTGDVQDSRKAAGSLRTGEKKSRRSGKKFWIPGALLLIALVIAAGIYVFSMPYLLMSENQKAKKGLLSDTVLWGSFSEESIVYRSNNKNFMDVTTDQGTWNLCEVPCFISVLPDLDKKIILLGFQDQFNYVYYLYGSYRIDQNQILTIGRPRRSVSPEDYRKLFTENYPEGSMDDIIRDLAGSAGEEPRMAALSQTLQYTLKFGYNGDRKYGPLYLKRVGSNSVTTYQNTLCKERYHSFFLKGMLSWPDPSVKLQGAFISWTENGNENDVRIVFPDGGITTDAVLQRLDNHEGKYELSYQKVQKHYNGRTELFDQKGSFYLSLINCSPYGFVVYDSNSKKYIYYQDYKTLPALMQAETE